MCLRLPGKRFKRIKTVLNFLQGDVNVWKMRFNEVALCAFCKGWYARRSVIRLCLQVHGRLGRIYSESAPKLVSCRSCLHTRFDVFHGGISGGLHLCCDIQEDERLCPTAT